MGVQKVAAMPADSDFERAAVWTLPAEQLAQYSDRADDIFLKINYQGDVARVYADGILVADNFWNGKSMLVRLSDIIGHRAELRILPLSADYPIYFQEPQRNILKQAPNGILLSLDNIEIIQRKTLRFED